VVLGLDRQVRVYANAVSVTAPLARHIAGAARKAVRTRGIFSIVLSGGQTPQPLYQLMAQSYRENLPWPTTEVFFADERCVPPDDPRSNYGMVRDTLLSHVPIARRHIHRLPGEVRPPSLAAARYSRVVGPLPVPAGPAQARFDLVLLGIGPDGHTASLFPGAPALRERQRTVVAVPRAGQPPYVPRLTLTLSALCSAREVCFLVAGEEKAAAVAAVFRAPGEGDPQFPASLVRAAGTTLWYLDLAAARALPPAASSAGSTPVAGRRP
jgi:6-phosphogluconolactonase